jgi:hypothetical protein
MIALLAGNIALHAARYRDLQEHKRHFIASKSLLPHALSAICKYCDDSLKCYASAHQKIKKNGMSCRQNLRQEYPRLPVESLNTVKECILYSPPSVRDRLSSILSKTQVCDARMSSMFNHQDPEHSTTHATEMNIFDEVHSVCLLRLHVNIMFPFARGEEEEPKPKNKFTTDEYLAVIRIANLAPNAFEGIHRYFKKYYDKKNS